MTDIHTGLESPRGVWWQPAHRSEKVWVSIAFGWCLVLFAMMPLWHLKGGQNPSGIRRRVQPTAFYKPQDEDAFNALRDVEWFSETLTKMLGVETLNRLFEELCL